MKGSIFRFLCQKGKWVYFSKLYLHDFLKPRTGWHYCSLLIGWCTSFPSSYFESKQMWVVIWISSPVVKQLHLKMHLCLHLHRKDLQTISYWSKLLFLIKACNRITVGVIQKISGLSGSQDTKSTAFVPSNINLCGYMQHNPKRKWWHLNLSQTSQN